ncbi:MAG: glycosyltransferase family A protein [Nitratireductor sp.]
MNALVSISVPTYERAELAKICLESLRDQTYANIEVSVFDNSGTGDIEKLVMEIGDPRFSYNRNDPGVSDILILNHRRAFAPRKGKYHFVLTSDYALAPSAISKMVEALETNPGICAVSCGTKTLDLKSGKETPERDKLVESKHYDKADQTLDSTSLVISAFSSFSGVGLVYHSLLHSSLLENRMISDIYFNHASEHHLGLELLMVKPKFGYIAEPLKISIENNDHYSEQRYRGNAHFAQWICREMFFTQHYAELTARNYPILKMRLGIIRGYLRASMSRHPADAVFEPLLLAMRQLTPVLAACAVGILLSPIYVVRKLFRRAR